MVVAVTALWRCTFKLRRGHNKTGYKDKVQCRLPPYVKFSILYSPWLCHNLYFSLQGRKLSWNAIFYLSVYTAGLLFAVVILFRMQRSQNKNQDFQAFLENLQSSTFLPKHYILCRSKEPLNTNACNTQALILQKIQKDHYLLPVTRVM